MSKMLRIAESALIFNKYLPETDGLHVTRTWEIYVNFSPSRVQTEDRKLLKELGWQEQQEEDIFVFEPY